MPVYDFACQACGTEFEARTEPGATAPCPACGAGPERTRRLWRPIAPPARIGLRGREAQRSNDARRRREARRRGED
jgi:putative FmdB family regulatory protein